jgi:HSP20 family protein
MEFETDFPWMTEVFGPEAGIFGREGKFLPEANMVETDKAVGHRRTPGMDPRRSVEIKERNLWITGEKKEEKEGKGRTFHRVERRAGMFRRIFPLPVGGGRRWMPGLWTEC